MPGGDRTGPIGHGPGTGRSLGLCAGYSHPGYAFPGFGRGFGRGLGKGLGRRYLGRRPFWFRNNYPNVYYPPIQGGLPTYTKEEEKTYLEETIKELEQDIKDIRAKIKDLTEEK